VAVYLCTFSETFSNPVCTCFLFSWLVIAYSFILSEGLAREWMEFFGNREHESLEIICRIFSRSSLSFHRG
jgi:hypothetical protein